MLLSSVLNDFQKYLYVHLINWRWKNITVVKHLGNNALNKLIINYMILINNNPTFFVFDSIEILNAAKTVNDTLLKKWIKLYKGFYKV